MGRLVQRSVIRVLILGFLLTTASAQRERSPGSRFSASPTASALPPGVTKECPDDIEDLDHCPVTGCGKLGDTELNRAKNRTDLPAPTDIQKLTIEEIKAKPQPTKWDTGSDRAALKTKGEGKAVRVLGFLLKVKPEGGESCNCELTHRADTDVHFALVSEPEDAEEDSITAEVSPRVRQVHKHGEKWEYKNLNDYEGQFMRVTGWLMLDTKHLPQAHRLAEERPNKGLKRASNWEIHPITKLERCTKSVSSCKAGHGWEEI